MAKSFDREFEQWYRIEKAAKEYAEAKEKDKVRELQPYSCS